MKLICSAVLALALAGCVSPGPTIPVPTWTDQQAITACQRVDGVIDTATVLGNLKVLSDDTLRAITPSVRYLGSKCHGAHPPTPADVEGDAFVAARKILFQKLGVSLP